MKMRSTFLIILAVCSRVTSSYELRERRGLKGKDDVPKRRLDRHYQHDGSSSSNKSQKKSSSYRGNGYYPPPKASDGHKKPSYSPDVASGSSMDEGGKHPPTGSMASDDEAGMGSPVSTCISPIAEQILTIPEAVTMNPHRCCNFVGPTMVFVTHGETDPLTITGFEPFWNSIYLEIASTAEMSDVCFVMSGYNPDTQSDKTLNDFLLEVNELVSTIPNVISMMSTDPTEDLSLVNLIREISDAPGKPNIGIFNAGRKNIETESLVSGRQTLPYVGYTDDSQYGSEAAAITLRLLNKESANALCFNGKPELTYIGRRCAAYYNDVSDNPPSRLFGISCRADSNVNAILALIIETDAHAVYSQIDCCPPVAMAAEMAKAQLNHTIVVGCQDEDTSGGKIDFVVGQPIALQAYETASWATLPVLETLEGQDGKATEYFPSLRSLLETDIYTSLLVF